jgi:hypothetical protein
MADKHQLAKSNEHYRHIHPTDAALSDAALAVEVAKAKAVAEAKAKAAITTTVSPQPVAAT